MYALMGMTAVAGVQLVGSALGFWFGFAWVMSNPVTIIIALLGVIYLIASMVANQYKREGLRLWLYRSSWGKSPTWTHSDEDHKKELRTLTEICLRPSLAARASTLPYYGRGPRIYTGFWLQLLLPSKLEGTAVKLQPAMVDSGWFSDSLMQGMADKFYDQFLEGHWAPIEQFGQPPHSARTGRCLVTPSTPRAHSTVFGKPGSPTSAPVLELEVRYPEQILESANGQGYMFRVDIGTSSSEADLKSDAFSKEPNNDMVLSSQSTRLLSLQVPHTSE